MAREASVKQWIGQLAEDPRLWFMVWARDRRAARAVIQEDLGPIVSGSIREIKGPGYFLFQAVVKRSEKVSLAELQPPEGEYLILYDQRAEEWIVNRARPKAQAAPAPRPKAARPKVARVKVKSAAGKRAAQSASRSATRPPPASITD